MQEHTLTITIERAARDVFEFTLDPHNTATWIDSIIEEQASEYPPKVGTKYRNHGHDGVWHEYTLTHYEPSSSFTLHRIDSPYGVRYTVRPLGEHKSELEYHEWVDEGELDEVFDQSSLEKLKIVLESS